MADRQSRIDLVVGYKGGETIAALSKSTENYKALLGALNESMARGDVTAEEYTAQYGRLSGELGRQTRLMEDFTAAANRERQELERVAQAEADAAREAAQLATSERDAYTSIRVTTSGVMELSGRLHTAEADMRHLRTATDGAAKGALNMGSTVRDSGRIFQDFMQGGMGGILNNIEGFTVSLGLGTGLAGAFTILATAATFAGPPIYHYFEGLLAGANDVPKATDAVKRLSEELEKNGKRLDELKDKQKLTNAELVEFTKLTARATALEKAAEAAREQVAANKSLKDLKPDAVLQNQKDSAKALQALAPAGPAQESMVKAMAEGLRQASDAALEQAQNNVNQYAGVKDGTAQAPARDEALRQFRFYQERAGNTPAAQAANAKDARELLARAAQDGKAADVERLGRLAQRAPEVFSDTQRYAIRRAQPGAAKAEDETADAEAAAADANRAAKHAAGQVQLAKDKRANDLRELQAKNARQTRANEAVANLGDDLTPAGRPLSSPPKSGNARDRARKAAAYAKQEARSIGRALSDAGRAERMKAGKGSTGMTMPKGFRAGVPLGAARRGATLPAMGATGAALQAAASLSRGGKVTGQTLATTGGVLTLLGQVQANQKSQALISTAQAQALRAYQAEQARVNATMAQAAAATQRQNAGTRSNLNQVPFTGR
jgi:hypothetical protein